MKPGKGCGEIYFRTLAEVVQDARKGHDRRVTGGEPGRGQVLGKVRKAIVISA